MVEKPIVWATSTSLQGAKQATLNIDNKFIPNYSSSNIIARIKGRRHDSCFVFTAHYDHLGNIGSKVFCPGVNDNASGTAAIVTLAQYYRQHQPEFDMWFIAFAGEEAGLRGSSYFVENPSFDLSRIKYLFNLDMIGDNNPIQYCEVSPQGLDGFHQLQAINAQQHLFDSLSLGPLAANSDHHPFAVKGVPCILFEQQEGDFFQYYHTPQDNMQHFCTISYPKVFKLVTSFIQANSQALPVAFIEGVDLMALVWRLAGDRPFCANTVPSYFQSADAFFKDFSHHPAVEMARQLIASGISYDAVASYGLHLLIAPDGSLSFNRQLATHGDSSFDRWSPQQKKTFLPLLEDFYRQSHFHLWYAQTELYRTNAINAFQQVARLVDLTWFDSFFGPMPHNSHYQVVLSILCGVNNYGCSAPIKGGGEWISPVISSCNEDDQGQLVFDVNKVLPIVIHEFCHAYCNPLDAQFWNAMQQHASQIFLLKQDLLTSQAYTSPLTMINETFVRTSVIQYMKLHFPHSDISSQISSTSNMGFVLTQEYVNALDHYSSNKDHYPTMASFMPELVKVVNSFDCQQFLLDEAEGQKLEASYSCNIADSDIIPSGESNLIITFSKPILFNVALGYGNGEGKFISLARGLESISLSDDHRVLTIALNLEPNTKYSFSILGSEFHTEDGHTAGPTTYINFSTK